MENPTCKPRCTEYDCAVESVGMSRPCCHHTAIPPSPPILAAHPQPTYVPPGGILVCMVGNPPTPTTKLQCQPGTHILLDRAAWIVLVTAGALGSQMWSYKLIQGFFRTKKKKLAAVAKLE